MAEHGAAMQTYVQELVKFLEELKVRKRDLQELTKKEEHELATLRKQAKALHERISYLEEKVKAHSKITEEYEGIIRETENGFKKVVESSCTLLNVSQHEANRLEEITRTIDKTKSV